MHSEQTGGLLSLLLTTFAIRAVLCTARIALFIFYPCKPSI